MKVKEVIDESKKMADLSITGTKKMEGKVVLITGSSSGIGRAMALEYCRQGADVTIHGRDEKKLQEVKEECEKLITGKQKVLAIIGDLKKEEIRQRLVDETINFFGKLNILINNAGYANILPVEKNEGLKPLDDMLDIHVRVPYHLTKLAIPELIKNKGVLINFSSVAGLGTVPMGNFTEYSMAKCCLEQFTRWVAFELGPKGVRALNINPAAIATSFGVNSGLASEADSAAMMSLAGPVHALQRVGQAEEVAKVTVFMTSDDASFMTGSNVLVDGGLNIMPAGPHLMPAQ